VNTTLNETLLEWSGAARGEHFLTRAAIVSVPICSEAQHFNVKPVFTSKASPPFKVNLPWVPLGALHRWNRVALKVQVTELVLGITAG
jgi:hypothetical protein